MSDSENSSPERSPSPEAAAEDVPQAGAGAVEEPEPPKKPAPKRRGRSVAKKKATAAKSRPASRSRSVLPARPVLSRQASVRSDVIARHNRVRFHVFDAFIIPHG